MKKTVYLSLGSNLGDRAGNLRQAINRLAELGSIMAVSSIYETEPVEVERSQPWFLNCVVAVETELMPKQFLARSLAIEQELGRRRGPQHARFSRAGVGRRVEKKDPRTLDIDILFFGNAIVKSPGLTIPHPALHQRRFVLEPLVEIAPDLRHPVMKRTARELLQNLPAASGRLKKA